MKFTPILGAALLLVAGCAHDGLRRPDPPTTKVQASIKELAPLKVAVPVEGVILGQGYDFVSSRWLKSTCVQGKSLPLGASEVEASFTDLQDREQVFNSLKVSASGGVDFGAAGASVEVSFARSVSLDRERRNILATIGSFKGGAQLVPADSEFTLRLSPAAARLASLDAEGSGSSFRQACGDGFIAAVRTGAKLSMVFSYDMDKKELEESLKISAEGKYGPAKGKASMERIHKETSVQDRTSVAYLQKGGNRKLVPRSAKEALDVIGAAGDYKDEDAAPLEVVILPYRTLHDLPDKLRAKPLPGLEVKGLAAHYWRLADLSAVYSAAANSPVSYYHPYTESSELGKKAHALKQAALCTAQLVDICASSSEAGQCEFAKLLELAKKTQACYVLSSASREKPEELAEAKSIASFIVGEGRAEALVGPDMRLEPKENGVGQSPYDVYLRHLAQGPLRKSRTNSALNDGDEIKLWQTYCAIEQIPCSGLEYNALAGDGPTGDVLAKAQNGLFDYIVRFKLAGVVAASCAIDLTHPLCLSSDVVPTYLSERQSDGKYHELKATFGTTRGFSPLDKPAPPPATPPKRDPPVRPPCTHHCPPV